MTKKAKFVFVIISLFSAFCAMPSMAQTNIGIKFSYNLHGVFASQIAVSPTSSENAAGNPQHFKVMNGFAAGPVVECRLNDNWAIQPGARFSMQGFKDKYNSGGQIVRRFHLFYLQVPVYAQYRHKVTENLHIVGQAGPYLGFGLFGRQYYSKKGKSVEIGDTYKKISFGSSMDEDIHSRADFGVGVGFGIEYGRLQVMLSEDFGIYNATFKKKAYSADYNIKMRQHVFAVSLAIIFGKKIKHIVED